MQATQLIFSAMFAASCVCAQWDLGHRVPVKTRIARPKAGQRRTGANRIKVQFRRQPMRLSLRICDVPHSLHR